MSQDISQTNSCQFCGKSFRTKQNLQTHIRTAKYCIEMRGECIPSSTFCCEFCNAQFLLKSPLTLHLKSCPEKKKLDAKTELDNVKELLNEKELKFQERSKWYEEQYKTQNETIKRLKVKCCEERAQNLKLKLEMTEKLNNKNAELKQLNERYQQQLLECEQKNTKIQEQKLKLKAQNTKIVSMQNDICTGKGIIYGMNNAKPQTIINKKKMVLNQKLAAIPIANINPLTIEFANENIDNYSYELFLKREAGISEFITNMTILKLDDGTVEKNYACTDRSRSSFHRLVEDKAWKRDGGAMFINEILNLLYEPASEYMERYEAEYAQIPNVDQNQFQFNQKMLMNEFVCGLRKKESKSRENIFNEVKCAVRNTNGC